MKYKKIDSKEKLEYNVKRLSQTCIREFQMRYTNYSTKNRKGKHINYEERIKLEALLVFAIERIKNGVVIQDSFVYEIKYLYPEEFLIELEAKKLIKGLQKTGKQFFVKMMYTLFCKLFSR